MYRIPAASRLAMIAAATSLTSLGASQSVQAQSPAPTVQTTAPPSGSAPQVAVPQIVVKPAAQAKPEPSAKRLPEAAVAQPALVQPQPAAVTPAAAAPGAPNVFAAPTGQTVTTVGRANVENTPVFSVGDLLQEVPGISIKQGNGPRDLGLSIRGSNARNGFGVRNIVVLEDGFPVTQPDGLSRTDLIDPRAYGGVDVFRGPSSVLFGNYATGGAVNFRLRPGGEINGWEQGVDVGSFGYLNNYTALGAKAGAFEASLFMSDVRGDGTIRHSQFNTQTVNFLMTVKPTNEDRLIFKVIDNQLEGNLSNRLTLSQFYTNPFQRGCVVAAGAPSGCAVVGLFNNGFNGTRINRTADEGGFNRDDRRTIGAVRWEHDFGPNATWRNQFVFDNRDINQPTGSTSAIGVFPSYNVSSDLTIRNTVFGLPATHFVGAYWNTMEWSSDTRNVIPFTDGSAGALTARVYGLTENKGLRGREEIAFTPQLTGVVGYAVETSTVAGRNLAYSTTVLDAIQSTTYADRQFFNRAYEGALLWKVDPAWTLRARVATAYGIPQLSNMFTKADGSLGNNTDLQPQTNLGYDIGADWTPIKGLKLSLTGFYEFFTDELVTQATAVQGRTFTFNAPASEHRGVEAALDWRFLDGWRLTAAYTYNDQFYTEYTEQLGAGATFSSFNRAGNKIPGVSPNELLARIGYDQGWGPLKGWGAFAEYQWKDAFFMDNGNLLRAPGYDLVNLNVHYNGDEAQMRALGLHSLGIRGLQWFAEVKNVTDKVYVASANNITNSLASAGVQSSGSSLANTATGSIYAGAPQSFFTGLKVKF